MIKYLSKLATIAAFVSASGSAIAEPVLVTLDGNDCSGVFGQGLNNCKIPVLYDPNQSPVIAKFNTGADGGWEFSTLFPSVTADDFVLTINADGTGSWTYEKDAADPVITFFVAKAGSQFNLFKNNGDMLSGSWVTPDGQGLSHITFYDTNGGGTIIEVPEPGSLALVGLALLGVGLANRRKQQ